MNKTRAFRFINLILLILCMIILLSCDNDKKEKTATGSVYAFSTLIDISITSSDAENDLNNIKEIILDTHKLCDNFEEYEGINNVCTLNRVRNHVAVPDELMKLLVYCVSIRHDTDKYFEYYIGSLSNMYKKLIESGSVDDIPSDEEIALELEKIKNTKFYHHDDNTLSLNGDGLIDFGAIGKGYALSKALDYLKTHNIKTYLINAGSSSIIVGEKENSKEYRIGVREVDDLILEKKNKAIGTSSLLEQNVIINDKLYHHIVNPFTGYNDYYYDTVVVVGDDPLLMDVYSTVLFMMDEEKVKIMVDYFSLDEVYLCKDKKVIYEYKKVK